MKRGLPRPLEADENGRLMPVPYSQSTRFGVLDLDRAYRCERNDLCLVCGYRVSRKTGKVFVDAATEIVVDNAPLHPRCAKLTAAHCPTLRERLKSGAVSLEDYCRHL